MLNGIQKLIIWLCLTLAIGAITIIMLFQMAKILAILAVVLLFGVIIGVPLSIVLKSKWHKAIKGLSDEKNYHNKYPHWY